FRRVLFRSVERAHREIRFEERVHAREVAPARAGVGVVVPLGEARGPRPLLPGPRLAVPVGGDRADAAHAAEEAVLEVDEALRAALRVDVVAARLDPEEELVAQVLVGAIHAPDLVDEAPVPVAHRELDPDLALLAEARGHAVPRADVLDLDRDLDPEPAATCGADPEAERVAEEHVPAPPRRERDAVDVDGGLVDELG